MDREHVVLVFDVGTQSSRSMLVDSKGHVLAIEKMKHEPAYFADNLDWAEQDADYYYDCICKTSQICKEKNPDLWKRIEAVTITTIRDTVVCVDKEGKPLRRAILWLDKRLAEGSPVFPATSKIALKAVGMEKTADLQYKKSHCNWIRENEPEIWAKTDKFLFLSGYLIYKLTGNMKDAKASMIGHIPYDNKRRCWQKASALTRPVFPVEEEKLCELAETGEVLGYITESMENDSGIKAGIPVIASGSDKACEIMGLGCVMPEKAAIGLGTTATITYMSDKYVEPERFIPPYAAVIPGSYNPEIEIFRGYWLISWFKKEFAAKEEVKARELGVSAEEVLNKELSEIPAGCEGLLFQPYFTPNITMPTARGAVIGFSDVHTRIHIYRAIIEGINFALMDGLKLMEKKSGRKFESISVGGGGAQSDEICQITADMFGVPVIRAQSFEATGVGAALAAFVGMGVFDSYEAAVSEMIHIKDSFEPREEMTKIYDKLYNEVFKEIYGRLSPLYKKLSDIYHTS